MAIKHRVSKLLSRTAVLKVKYAKQLLWRTLHGKRKIITSHGYQVISKVNTHVFFGYYDVSPFNPKSDEIVYLNVVDAYGKASIYLSQLCDTKTERKIAETNAWNWQQGCRLRWMPDNSRQIFMNDYLDGYYCSRIVDVDSGAERRLDYPLYDISSDGKMGLSLDFERLGVKRPGYGYTCRPYVEDAEMLPELGIDIINLAENSSRRVITYSKIAAIVGKSDLDFRNNYLNHLSFSPSGRRFLFFWLTIDNRYHRAFLLVHDLDTNETRLLEKDAKVSHYVWIDDDHIICTAIADSKKCRYNLYTVSTAEKCALNPSTLNRDGHPSIYSASQILTDTYPDLNGYQQLFIAGINDNSHQSVLSIYSNCCVEGERRTDLHPRLNADKSVVCFDANSRKHRELFLLNL